MWGGGGFWEVLTDCNCSTETEKDQCKLVYVGRRVLVSADCNCSIEPPNVLRKKPSIAAPNTLLLTHVTTHGMR